MHIITDRGFATAGILHPVAAYIGGGKSKNLREVWTVALSENERELVPSSPHRG